MYVGTGSTAPKYFPTTEANLCKEELSIVTAFVRHTRLVRQLALMLLTTFQAEQLSPPP
jgi:hypothetical protein